MCVPLLSYNHSLIVVFLCHKTTSYLNHYKEMVHKAPTNITGTIFSVIFKILHLLYMSDTMVNVIIEIFIKENKTE
jgi:hypothetical protein